MWYHHVDYMVDDSWQVCKETLEKGYPTVTPIAVQTPEQSHWRFQGQEGITVVPDFPAAPQDPAGSGGQGLALEKEWALAAARGALEKAALQPLEKGKAMNQPQ